MVGLYAGDANLHTLLPAAVSALGDIARFVLSGGQLHIKLCGIMLLKLMRGICIDNSQNVTRNMKNRQLIKKRKRRLRRQRYPEFTIQKSVKTRRMDSYYIGTIYYINHEAFHSGETSIKKFNQIIGTSSWSFSNQCKFSFRSRTTEKSCLYNTSISRSFIKKYGERYTIDQDIIEIGNEIDVTDMEKSDSFSECDCIFQTEYEVANENETKTIEDASSFESDKCSLKKSNVSYELNVNTKSTYEVNVDKERLKFLGGMLSDLHKPIEVLGEIDFTVNWQKETRINNEKSAEKNKKLHQHYLDESGRQELKVQNLR